MNDKQTTNVYKSTATFTIPKEELQSYRNEVMKTIRIARMTLMSDGRVLQWLDEELAKFPKEEEKPKEEE